MKKKNRNLCIFLLAAVIVGSKVKYDGRPVFVKLKLGSTRMAYTDIPVNRGDMQ